MADILQNSETSDKRLSILTPLEIKLIYGLPELSNLERRRYFDLEEVEEDIVHEKFVNLNSKIYFILQLGYFKKTHRFFKFNSSEVKDDVQYILEKYFPDNISSDFNVACNKKTRLKHQSIILKLFSHRLPTALDNNNLFQKAKSVVLIDANPQYIFKEIVRFTSEYKIILPAYSTMQKLISKAIVASDKELCDKLRNLMDDDLIQNINNLLVRESKTRYQLTIIKSPPQNFSKKQAINERSKQELLDPIFLKAKIILKQLRTL